MNRQAISSLNNWLYSPLALAVVVIVSFFWQLGAVPLFDLDEGAFSEATREILATGNFIATYLDGAPRYDKPILSYWLQALSVTLLGADEFAFRLPSALAATLWMAAIFIFTRQQLDQRSAYVAVLLSANVVGVIMIGRAATADALLNLWLALIFFDMYRYFEKADTRLICRVFLWLGLGFLTKGPVIIVLPLLASGLFVLFSQDHRKLWWKALIHWPGWLIFLIVIVPWHVLVFFEQGVDYFIGFFLEHNLQRFSQTREGHGGFLLYYFLALPLILLPFSHWFLYLLWRLKTLTIDPLDRFCWCWLAAVFVFFSLSQTQLPHYVLYGCTPVFILLARHRELIQQRSWVLLPALLLPLIIAFLPEIPAIAEPFLKRDYERELLQRGPEVFTFSYRMIAYSALLLIALLLFWLRRQTWQVLILTSIVQTALIMTLLVPALAGIQQTPVKQAALIARNHPQTVVAFGINMPSFSVYRDAITPRRFPKTGEIVFTKVDKLSELQQHFSDRLLQTLYRSGGVALLLIPDDAETEQ